MPTCIRNVRKVVINPQGLALANKRSLWTLVFFHVKVHLVLYVTSELIKNHHIKHVLLML